MKNVFKILSAVLSAILPVAGFICFAGIYDFLLYNLLWCGFYGCISVCFLFKSKLYKSVVIIANLAIILLCAFGALMGGIYGIWLIFLFLIIPFYSFWLVRESAMFIGIIILALAGTCFIVFGYLIYFKQKYNLINDFKEDYKAGRKDEDYAKKVGLIEMIVGTAILLLTIGMAIFH